MDSNFLGYIFMRCIYIDNSFYVTVHAIKVKVCSSKNDKNSTICHLIFVSHAIRSRYMMNLMDVGPIGQIC